MGMGLQRWRGDWNYLLPAHQPRLHISSSKYDLCSDSNSNRSRRCEYNDSQHHC